MLANILNLWESSQSPSQFRLSKVSLCYFPVSVVKSLLEAFMPQDYSRSKATCIWPFFGADAFQYVVPSCRRRIQIALSSLGTIHLTRKC